MLKTWLSVLLVFLFTPLLSAQATSSDLDPATATVIPSATFSTSEEFMPVSATQIFEESISVTATLSINPTATSTATESSQTYMITASTPFSSALLESTPSPMISSSPVLQTSDVVSSSSTVTSATTGDFVSSTVQPVTPTMNSQPPLTQETELESGSTENEFPSAAIVGIAVGAIVIVTALSLSTALIICFCCSWIGNKKYEYSTGNEHRMTIQQWNVTSAQYNMNRADSLSSIASSKSRGSSLFGSLGFGGRRYSNSADHVTSFGNISVPDLYSTPL